MTRSLLLTLLVSVFCLVFANESNAQTAPPSGQFGVGLFLQSGGFGGTTLTYAINHNMHVGTLFGFAAVSSGGASNTEFLLAPFFHYVFDGVVSPYVGGGISIYSYGGTQTSFILGGGLAYYWQQTFGAHIDLDFITIGLDPSGSTIGFVAPRMGFDWFLGR